MRFALHEVNAVRIKDAVQRRIEDVPHAAAWWSSQLSADNRRLLTSFRNLHAGQRCIVMGNGPSLGKMDLTCLRGEVTFGTNRIYLLYDKLPFVPTYYTCMNELVLEQFQHEISPLASMKFVNWNRRRLFAPSPSLACLRAGLTLIDFFGTDLTATICSGGTVTYVALQLAYFMGFRTIILVGVDHRFVEKGTPNRTEVRLAERDESHFHPNYFPKGSRWQLPDLVRSEHAYALARKAFERDGRRVLDATVDGSCDVFEKMDLKAALQIT